MLILGIRNLRRLLLWGLVAVALSLLYKIRYLLRVKFP